MAILRGEVAWERLGGQLFQKHPKIVKNYAKYGHIQGEKGEKGIAFGGQIDSKILINGQGLRKIWSFLGGEVS